MVAKRVMEVDDCFAPLPCVSSFPLRVKCPLEPSKTVCYSPGDRGNNHGIWN